LDTNAKIQTQNYICLIEIHETNSKIHSDGLQRKRSHMERTKTEVYWVKFRNIEIIGLNVSTECK